MYKDALLIEGKLNNSEPRQTNASITPNFDDSILHFLSPERSSMSLSHHHAGKAHLQSYGNSKWQQTVAFCPFTVTAVSDSIYPEQVSK